MYVIEPMTIGDADLTSSNLPENDYAAWNSGTSYSANALVVVVSTHSVYQAVVANTNKNPVTDDGTNWLRVSATNKWRAFDKRLSQLTTNSGDITYTIQTNTFVSAISFFGLSGLSVTVKVFDVGSVEQYNQTFSLSDTSEISTYYEYFTFETTVMETLTVSGLTAFNGYSIEITISGSNTAVGQIVMGKLDRLGYTSEGTVVGFNDFSTKERNEVFGYVEVVERGFSDYVDFKFTIEYADLGRVERKIKKLRSTPAVWLVSPEINFLSSTVYGFQAGEFRASLKSTGLHSATLEIEGLV